MENVTKSHIIKALRELGIDNGDIVLVHSSLKSLGQVDGGAETVVSGFLEAVGEEGTVVFPTLCQQDFENSYKTWHLDKQSDVGYLTNYFRKRPGSKRSDQATHSVAARGAQADEITKTHGETGKRLGPFGDTPFSADSPWEKMYKMDAKVVMLGVSTLYITFRHYAEYVYIEECLERIKDRPDFEELKAELWEFGKKGAWPHIDNDVLTIDLRERGLVAESKCGDAVLTCVSAKAFVDYSIDCLRKGRADVIREAFRGEYLEWAEKIK